MKKVTLTKDMVESIIKAYVDEEEEEDIVLATSVSHQLGQLWTLFRGIGKEEIICYIPEPKVAWDAILTGKNKKKKK